MQRQVTIVWDRNMAIPGTLSDLLAIVSVVVVFWTQEHVINNVVEHHETSVGCFNSFHYFLNDMNSNKTTFEQLYVNVKIT
jgi:hypothetical protein